MQRAYSSLPSYPLNATTNSAAGVADIRKIYPIMELMQRIGMPLLVHGEVTESHVDIFDREKEFIERILVKILRDFPALKVVFEHITTIDAVSFVESSGHNLAATITPHHLTINRNAIFQGGIRPNFYCLPIAKREHHRIALRKAATSGSSKFFLGTDSAPHFIQDKESACGCAGIFNAPCAIESYARVFEEEQALDRFEVFASENGPKFYGLPLNEDFIELERKQTFVAEKIKISENYIVPFYAGETLNWTLK
jgi:dihydroorotase